MSNSESPISINEHLSALLDDEAGTFEQRRVLDELKTDKNLSHKLSTYALIGETLRAGEAEKPVLSLGNGFLDSIHEKIEQEESFEKVVLEANTSTASNDDSSDNSSKGVFSWLRPVGGFAVAASVGAMVFMGLQNAGVLNSPQSQPSGIVDNSAPTAIVQTAPVAPVAPVNNTLTNNTLTNNTLTDIQADSIAAIADDQYVDADAHTRSLLKRYVDSHMQYTNSSAFVPSVRVIAYTDNQ